MATKMVKPWLDESWKPKRTYCHICGWSEIKEDARKCPKCSMNAFPESKYDGFDVKDMKEEIYRLIVVWPAEKASKEIMELIYATKYEW